MSTPDQQHEATAEKPSTAGDAIERARAAAHAHLEFVHTTLRTLDDNEARRARASRLPSPHG